MAWVLEHSASKGNDRCVLFALANRFDPKEPERCWPSIPTIASEANVSKRTAQRSLDHLVTLGEVLVFARRGGSESCRDDRRPNLYVLPALTAWRPDEVPTCRPATGCQTMPDGVPEWRARGDNGGARGVTTVARDSSVDPSPDPTVNGSPLAPASLFADPQPVSDSVDNRARRVLEEVWATRKELGQPPPANYIAALKVVARVLDAGWTDAAVVAACLAVPTISVGWLEGHLNKQTRPASPTARRGGDRVVAGAMSKADRHAAMYGGTR